jgi:hypothetical protein
LGVLTVSTDHVTSTVDVRQWWRRVPFHRAVALYVAVRLATLVIVAIVDVVNHHGIINDLSTWDGVWFLKAVYHGYPSHLPMASGHVLANPIALFPLFPLIIRALANITQLSAPVIGLMVSATAGLAAVIAVGKVTNEYTTRDRAERAALLFAVAPGSFVFSLMYNEGIVITLAAIGLIALMRRKWLIAGVVGAVATLTSPVGLVFSVCCVVSSFVALRRNREWRSLIAPVLAPLGFVTYMTYLWIHTGNLRAWQRTERDGWNSFPSLFYPLRILGKFIFNPLSPTMTGQILFFGTIVSVALLVVAFREHLPFELLTYATVAVLFFAISSPVGLRPRLVMLAFPLTIAAATRWRGTKFRVVLAVSALLLILMTYESLTSYAVFP